MNTLSLTNNEVVANSPAFAIGIAYLSKAHATGLLFQQTVLAQGLQNIVGVATTVQGVTQIYSTDTIANAVSMAKLIHELSD